MAHGNPGTPHLEDCHIRSSYFVLTVYIMAPDHIPQLLHRPRRVQCAHSQPCYKSRFDHLLRHPTRNDLSTPCQSQKARSSNSPIPSHVRTNTAIQPMYAPYSVYISPTSEPRKLESYGGSSRICQAPDCNAPHKSQRVSTSNVGSTLESRRAQFKKENTAGLARRSAYRTP